MTEQAGAATRLDDNLWILDTFFQGDPQVIAVYLLAGPDGLALIDVGSSVSMEQVLDGVRASGHDPEQITHLILTHVHLDHAGAAGTLARRLPRAQVYVHRLGAPHLIDPTKLVSSATRIYGARMGTLWGEIEPVPAERLVILDEGDELRVGGRTLRALYTPGHAVHHLAYHDAARNVVFTGDVAGVRLPGLDYVRPPTPPPDLNMEDWSASIARLEALHPARLYLAHFSQVTETAPHLAQLRARLFAWGELLLPGIRQGASDQELEGKLRDYSAADLARAASQASADAAEVAHRYEVATNYLMSAQGYVRYYRKQHPDRLT